MMNEDILYVLYGFVCSLAIVAIYWIFVLFMTRKDNVSVEHDVETKQTPSEMISLICENIEKNLDQWITHDFYSIVMFDETGIKMKIEINNNEFGEDRVAIDNYFFFESDVDVELIKQAIINHGEKQHDRRYQSAIELLTTEES